MQPPLNETTEYLSGVGFTPPTIAQIHDSTRGAPTVLAVIRRNIERGESVERVLADLPKILSDAYQWEWGQVAADDELQRDALAVLAHDVRAYTLEQLAKVLERPWESVSAVLRGLTFMVVGDSKAGEVRYVSDAFKRFATEKLAVLRGAVIDRLIDFMMKHRESIESQLTLPRYLREAGKLDALIDFVSVDYIAAMVQRSPTLAVVQNHAELGIAAAREKGRNMDLVRLTLQKATIAEFDDAEVGRSEIRALSALGDHEVALAIAEGAHRHEDRLLLLASLARARREAKLPVPVGVEEQIVELYGSVNFGVLGDRSELLAADLVYFRPDLALSTVERSSAAKAPVSTDARLELRQACL